jgi:hypothetical protein
MNIKKNYSSYNIITFFTYGFIMYVFLQDIYIDIRILKYEYNFKYEWNILFLSIFSIIFIFKRIYYFYLFLLLSYLYIYDKIYNFIIK